MALTASLISSDVYPVRRAAALGRAQEQGLRGLLVWGRGGETGESVNDILFFANHFSAFPGQPPQPPYLTAIEHAAVVIAPDGHSTLLATDFVTKGAQADEIRHSHDLYGIVVYVMV